MSKQAAKHHTKAAEHHEHAARYHKEAVKHHEARQSRESRAPCSCCTRTPSTGNSSRRGGNKIPSRASRQEVELALRKKPPSRSRYRTIISIGKNSQLARVRRSRYEKPSALLTGDFHTARGGATACTGLSDKAHLVLFERFF